jgi:nitrile hydratase subunit alpha
MTDEVNHRHGVHDPHYRHLAVAVRELLVEHGVLDEARIERQMARMDARSPADGARMVARAWTDEAYRTRMLADGSAAAEELGLVVDGTLLVVVENTDNVHNLFVCTLCSCYPRSILGLPPDWYKAQEYRKRVVREPRTVLGEFGVAVEDNVELRVHDSTADMRYMVLPRRPDGTEGWSEEALAKLVTRDSMIGVGLPLTPQAAQAAE